MVDEGKALIESLALSSNNAIQAELLLENLAETRFAQLAESARDELLTSDDPENFRRFTETNDLRHIDLLDEDSHIIGSDRWVSGSWPDYPPEVIAEIHDLQVMGGGYRSVMLQPDTSRPVMHYYIYEYMPEGNIVVMTAEANYLGEITRQIGIGSLIQRISNQAGIDYILLQSRGGIIFASRPMQPVLSIAADSFLETLMDADTIGWRFHEFEGSGVLEIARRFESVTYPPGVYRIGLDLTEYNEVLKSYDSQAVTIAASLFILTLLVVAVVALNQNYFLLDQSYRQMQSLSATVFNRLASAVIVFDHDRRIVALNASFTELTGIGADAVGSTSTAVSSKLPFALPDASDTAPGVIGSEQIIQTPTGDDRIVLIAMSSLPNEAGGGTVVMMHDITEQKQLEEKNRRQQRLSEMGDMAAGVAHEIRNPLNAISIAAQRLKAEYKPPEDVDEYTMLTSNILTETSRLNTILTRFLELARSKTLERDALAVAAPIRRAIASVEQECADRGVVLAIDLDDSLTVQADSDKLQQVFINLIRNSLQAMPDGGRIEITAESMASQAKIRVRDTGPGFPENVKHKIFQPYFTTKSDGSGLGLALTYKTITEMDGNVEAANAPDGGAVITILLPRA